MRRFAEGNLLELDKRDLLNSVNHLVEGYCVLAQAYHDYHLSGFPDLKNIFQMPDKGQHEIAEAMLNQVNDNELCETFTFLKENLQKLMELDRQIVDWLAHFVGLSPARDKKDRTSLERRLKKIVLGKSNGHPQGPVWVTKLEYQEFITKSGNILIAMNKSQQKINQRIAKLLGNYSEI